MALRLEAAPGGGVEFYHQVFAEQHKKNTLENAKTLSKLQQFFASNNFKKLKKTPFCLIHIYQV